MDEALYQKMKTGLTKSFDENLSHLANGYYMDHKDRAAYMSSLAAMAEALIKLEESAPKKKKISSIKPAL